VSCVLLITRAVDDFAGLSDRQLIICDVRLERVPVSLPFLSLHFTISLHYYYCWATASLLRSYWPCPPGLDHHRSVNPYIQYVTTLLANASCSDASVVRATPINRTYSGSQQFAAPRCPGVIATDRKRYCCMDITRRLPVRLGVMRICFAVSC